MDNKEKVNEMAKENDGIIRTSHTGSSMVCLRMV